MARWFYKHYKMLCMIFLGIVLVGWTAFTDISDRKAATAGALPGTAAGREGDTAPAGSDEGDVKVTGTADNSEEGRTNEEPSVPAQIASGDPADTDHNDQNSTDIGEVKTPGGDTADPGQNEENGQEPQSAQITDTTDDTGTQAPDGESDHSATGEPTGTVCPDPDDDPEGTTDPGVTDTPEDTGTGDQTPSFELTFKYAVAAVDSKLNIRLNAGTDSSVIAYLKSNGYCEVLEWGSEWTKIRSGSVTGYAYTPYLLFNNEAIGKLRSLNKLFVRVTSNTVNIRAQATTDSEKLGKATRDSKYIYLPESSVDGWYCIQYSETQTAFVSADYTEIFIDTSSAIPLS